jgi:hypothetical protein
LVACYREACSRVASAQLALLRTYFSQYGSRTRGPFDPSTIERANQKYLKEESRRERLLDALIQRAGAREQVADTWTGRGRKPNWLLARLKKGAKLSDFEI